jgi:hypothetical protein
MAGSLRPRGTRVALVAAVVLLGLLAALFGLNRGGATGLVSPAQAGLAAQVDVVPAGEVTAFLASRGITVDLAALPGPAVVAHVTWRARPAGRGATFTVLLADRQGRAGVINAVYGLPRGRAVLGSAAAMRSLAERTSWLVGDRPVRDTNGIRDVAQFATMPADWAGGAWLVGHVSTRDPDAEPTWVSDPAPVVGIAFATGDQVWWVHRAAG